VKGRKVGLRRRLKRQASADNSSGASVAWGSGADTSGVYELHRYRQLLLLARFERLARKKKKKKTLWGMVGRLGSGIGGRQQGEAALLQIWPGRTAVVHLAE